MFNTGVIDPKKVTRLALENASSVAGTFLITECIGSIPAEAYLKGNFLLRDFEDNFKY